jgi:hypothetical protein
MVVCGRALSVLALTVLALQAQAQDPVLHASVDRSSVRENESFNYVLRAEGDLRGEPDTTPLETQFEILNRSASQRIQYVNGQTQQVSEWTFALMPKAAGKFRVPPLHVGSAVSNAVDVDVLPAQNAASDAPADIFMEVTVDPGEAFVQSQVVFTLRLFVGVSIGRATLTAPQVSGGEAIVERLGEDRQYHAMRAGRDFLVRERRYAVFPQQTGKLTIGPATFEAMVIPNRGFSRLQRLRSDAADIDVKAAVPPPAEYPNAVWLPARELNIAERWSEEGKDFTLGVPRTRTLTVKAVGLLETQLPELPIESSDGIRQYPDQPELDRQVTDRGIEARRVERYAVIAQDSGRVEIAGVELPWFNTSTQRWDVARIPPRSVNVLPGEQPDTSAVPAPAAPPAAARAPPPAPDRWRWVSLFLASGWLLTVALWLRSRALPAAAESRGRAVSAPKRGANRALLRRLRAACDHGDAAAAAQGLLEWAALRFERDPPKTLGTLAARLPEDVAAELERLEAHLYGSVRTPWDGKALAAALGKIDAVREPGREQRADPLLPLYR